MKIYAMSILAFLPTENKDDYDSPITMVYQIPALVPAESIEDAAERAKEHAFERFKESEGYYGHQAAIMSVTKQFYEAAETAKQAGILDMTEDEPRCFNFDSGLDAEIIS